MLRPLCVACLLFLAGSACARPPAADPELLRLGEQVVRRSDFDQHLEGIEARSGTVDATVRLALLETFLAEGMAYNVGSAARTPPRPYVPPR